MPEQHNPRPTLLIVDDDALIQDTLAYALEDVFQISGAATRAEAIERVRASPRPPDVVLVDLGLPPHPHRADEGLQLIRELLAHDPLCKVVVLSGQNEEAHARHARTIGALEFLCKPVRPEVLRQVLEQALTLRRQELRSKSQQASPLQIVGHSPAINEARTRLRQYAALRFPVLIEGESGTGKEIAARALHDIGPAPAKPFVALNCAAISPGLIEATLFGHVRGSFTGAVSSQTGYFEQAGEGTLFLDEVGELPLELQPKLLRVLESGEYQRVGETQSRYARARVIAATNRDLREEVRQSRFRADLYHRLSVLRLEMPPLRALGEDRLVLLEHFLRDYCSQIDTPPFSLTDDARQLWLDYAFPGNVRELRNIIARLLSRFAGSTVSAQALHSELESERLGDRPDTPPPPLPGPADPPPAEAALELPGEGIDLDAQLRRIERDYIQAALEQARGNVSQAARLLGLNRSTLYNRIEALSRHGLLLPAHLQPSPPR